MHRLREREEDMGFEKVVLDKVEDVLGTDNLAYFAYGTLAVECSAREAAKIETALAEVVNCGIIVSSAGDEFLFDFTA
jgi:hypothetical protein